MKNKFIMILSPLLAFIIFITMNSNSGGITGKSVAGCGGSGCHGTVATASTIINVTGLPAAGYINSTVYSITLTISNTSITGVGSGLRDGFDMTASAGSFTAITGTALNGATEIRHSTPKAAPTGTISWTFNWTSPASGSATITFNVAGNATNGDGSATALDKYNTFSTTLVKAPVSVTAVASAITCNGGISTITATGAGGTSPFQYNVNGGTFQSATTFAGNLAGTYTISVKDALNAVATTLVTITQPVLIAFNAPVITPPLCNGGTGTLNMAATGGTGTKTYTITPLGPQSNTTGNFSALTAQTYTVTVTDANLCSKTSTVVMSQPSLMIFTAPVLTQPLCNGGTGNISTSASGGTGTKTYTITPLGPQSNISGNFSALTAQTYTITATDANNCAKTTIATLGQPTLINFGLSNITNPLCNGGTGNVTTSATGGTGTITYTITPLGPQSNTTGNFSALTAQTYTMTATDANNCTKTSIVTIGQPTLISFGTSTVTNPLCNGGTGNVTASATGGTGIITYTITPLGPQSNITGSFSALTAQTYTITATDANNCTKTSTVTVGQPTLINFGTSTVTNPLCNGGTGNVIASATGGTGAITYSIAPLGPQSNTIGNFSALTAQTYTMTATDANNCTNTSTTTVGQPSLISFGASIVTNPLCNGGTGNVIASATGGTGAITYSITPLGPQSNTTGNFSALTAQTYTITATDANNCTKTSTVILTAPIGIVFIAPALTNPVCNGGTNGSIQIIASGGTGTKFYSINPLGPQTNATGTFNNLTAQNYTITVIDANSCSITTTAILTQPSPVVVSSANVSGCQGSPIALIGSPTGGIFSQPNPYTGASTTYTYTYTNGVGCSGTSTPSSITVTPVSSANIVTTASSSFCETLTQVSGTNSYSNASCQLITSIAAAGLGTTNACVDFLPGTPSWNGEPYANRVYSITPAIQPSTIATVCLYYTSTDLAAAGITLNSDISITKVGGNGILGGSGSVTEITNASMTINNLFGGVKEVCFPVSSFSSFYLHSKNPNNVALPVELNSFVVHELGASDQLSWKTGSEMNNDYFNVQYSQDGILFEPIGKVFSKARSGNSAGELSYSFIHSNPRNGYNFYRLQQVDIDGKTRNSEIISVFRTIEENTILVYPNPSKGDFTIVSVQPVQVIISDINGKIVYKQNNVTNTNVYLHQTGIYAIKLVNAEGVQTIRKLIVE